MACLDLAASVAKTLLQYTRCTCRNVATSRRTICRAARKGGRALGPTCHDHSPGASYRRVGSLNQRFEDAVDVFGHGSRPLLTDEFFGLLDKRTDGVATALGETAAGYLTAIVAVLVAFLAFQIVVLVFLRNRIVVPVLIELLLEAHQFLRRPASTGGLPLLGLGRTRDFRCRRPRGSRSQGPRNGQLGRTEPLVNIGCDEALDGVGEVMRAQ